MPKCSRCGQIVPHMWGDICNKCRDEEEFMRIMMRSKMEYPNNFAKENKTEIGTAVDAKEIIIKKSLTADSRSCDYSKVTKQQLETATAWHIADVRKGLYYICELLYDRMLNHDKTKDNDAFYKSFISGFKDKSWLKLHYSKERHHLQTPEGVRNDVDLVDVIECVVDCVMAGMARSGKLSPISIPSDVLQKAVANTAEKLKDVIKIERE